MKALGIRERLDDALNPIVVKELRQAVQSRFVVVVLLLFLLIQLVFIGIYLITTGVRGELQSLDSDMGRTVFGTLQTILLITCMLFLPAYTGIRLAAERSDTNVDLLFVTTLRPRAIIWGKFVAAVLLAMLIFSACLPFMTFTYLLRGIEAPSMLLVVGIDFLVVLAMVQLAIFFAVIPTNWVLKGILGLVALGTLLFATSMTASGMWALLLIGSSFRWPDFWVPFICMCGTGLGAMFLFYCWSVALINPPSANRALGTRLGMLAVWLVSALLYGFAEVSFPESHIPLHIWMCLMIGMSALAVIIGINERERWGPRITRTIPRNPLLRVPAFLLYSGGAGGVLFGLTLFGLTMLVMAGWQQTYLDRTLVGHVGPSNFWEWDDFPPCSLCALYAYTYALAAVFVRRWVLKVRPVYTWVVMAVLVGLGSAIPYLITFMLDWRYFSHQRYYYLLFSNPIVGIDMVVSSGTKYTIGPQFFYVLGIVAVLMTVLNLPWFLNQIRLFRPYRRRPVAPEPPPLEIAPGQLDVTKTAG
jgi:hypothetical protein